MSFNEQVTKLKENWLLIVLVIISFLVLSFLLSGGSSLRSIGSNSMYDSYSYDKSIGSSEGYYPSSGNDFAPEVEERKIIKNSRLNLQVKGGDFFNADTKIKNIVSSSDSFILNENINSRESGRKDIFNGSYTIKVEASKLDFVVSQLKEIGKVTYFNEGSTDITGSYTNKEINLEVERERLLRYKEMYASADKISDKIDLNDRIFNQERTIKYLEDSISNMDQKIEYSTVNLSISEKYNYTNIVFVKVSDLVRALVNSINALLKFIFVILPFVLVGWIIYLIARKRKKL